ncbi:M50 family metallopeptidase [Actinomadura rudentiformis]|uniref:M50 family metallopeptidase n=1 Tax=Actinomadura rudentiformis TaxID=359158 RepID=A0A6H9YJC8_9ACTN|nr:M50 family metallopeptidase [Actinomadura rudentiformis]KAB2339978.1 M50 family metallopeptidase [Actinomadura rudentiformis]
MTAASAMDAARPQLRGDIVLGPAVRSGAALVHNVKDPAAAKYYQIGPREYFIMTRLDGRTPLKRIGLEYAEEFDRRLGEEQWRQILTSLAGRRLLTGSGEVAAPGEAGPAPASAPDRRTLLNARVTLFDPQRFFGRILPFLRFLFSAYFVVPALLAVTALQVLVAVKAGTLAGEARQLWEAPAAGLAVMLILWLSVAVHEAAHGLTATRFGGASTEIGILWRFPVLAPYCRVNDVLLFRRRWHRVCTAFAGLFASLLLMLPAAPLWMLAPEGSALRHAAAALLLFGSLSAVANLIPFLQLDGYFMLNHALGMQNLRLESYRFIRLALLHARQRDAGTAQRLKTYPRRVKLIYSLYGLGSIVFGAVLACWFAYWLLTLTLSFF